MDFGSVSSTVSAVPVDWIVIGAFFIIVSADALRAGSVRACALALSFPLTFLLFQILPQTFLLSPTLASFSSPLAQAVVFLILEAILFVCLHKMLASFDVYTSFHSAVVSGFAATVVVLVVWTQTPALQSLWHFTPQLQSIFGASYRFYWLIAAYLLLAFVGS